jgi:hypothetical protein
MQQDAHPSGPALHIGCRRLEPSLLCAVPAVG